MNILLIAPASGHWHQVGQKKLFNGKTFRFSIQATRGCPNRCDFCSVSAFHQATHRHRPIDEITAEIKHIPSRFFIFIDAAKISISTPLPGTPRYNLLKTASIKL